MEDDSCKVTVHSNAHKLLFDNNVSEISVKQNIAPLVSKKSEINQKKNRVPQLQKGLNKQQTGYSQKYIPKKSYVTPKKDESYSPIPAKIIHKAESDNPLFQANPLPNLYEEMKEQNMHEVYSQDNIQQVPMHNNYQPYNQNMRNVNNSQRHEVKKANFEQNRRNNFANVSSNIVSSREKRNSESTASSGLNTKISHSKNTNNGYVKMTGGPQFGTVQAMPSTNQAYKTDQNHYPSGMQAPVVDGAKAQKGRNKTKDSILTQYSHNLPPHQIEYKSGFQEIPPPLYNINEAEIQRKGQPRPLPGNTDLDDIDYYKDLRYSAQEPLPTSESGQMKENQAMKPPKPQSTQQQKKSAYKPYSLKEYKDRVCDPGAYRMGGLGANIGTDEWQQRNSKLQAMKSFASKVKIENRARSLNPPKRRKEEIKEKSKREKALEFAKNVPKPKLPPPKKAKLQKYNSKQENDDYDDMLNGMDYEPEEPKYSEFDELNQKHEDYLNEVNDIKKLFM